MLHAVQQGSGFFMAIGTGSFVTKTADIRKKNGLCMRAVFADIRAKKQAFRNRRLRNALYDRSKNYFFSA